MAAATAAAPLNDPTGAAPPRGAVRSGSVGARSRRTVRVAYYGRMGALGVAELIALVAFMAVPAAIFISAGVYVVKTARKGPEATLAAATRRRELA